MALVTPIVNSIPALDATKANTITFTANGGDQIVKNEIQIVNNGNDEITVDREDNKIVIKIDPVEEEEPEEVTEERGMVTSTDGLNIRQEPSVESERIGVLEYGAEVRILEDCGDWYRIDSGYIFKDYVIRI